MKNNKNRLYKLSSNCITRFLIVSFLMVVFGVNYVHAERKYLFKWDEGSGTNMPGWTWSDDVAYGHPGWTNIDAFDLVNSQIGSGPQSFQKSTYGDSTLARIVTDQRAPSTSSGGSLELYDDGSTNIYQATWWTWYDGIGLGKSPRNITDASTDRASWYIKVHATDIAGENPSEFGTPFHWGVYLCDDGSQEPNYTGCPYEGPGNQHYYYYLYYQPDIWFHTLLDRHPTFKRESSVAGNDPAYNYPFVSPDTGINYPMHMFENIMQWYMEIRDPQDAPSNFYIDEMYFYSTQDSTEEAEPNQNDDSVTSLSIGYDQLTGKWYVFWQDMSYTDSNGWNLNDNTNSTFEMRWSTSPITNANYDNANIISPEWFSGPEYTSYPNGIRRASSWYTRAWTRFDLPSGTEDVYNHLYFAIKDVSVAGGNAGTQWPYTNIDGHSAASPYIKTIDYYIRPDNTSTSSFRADVDNNSQINTTDAMLTLRNSLGLDMSGTNWQSSSTTGDADCDGDTDSTDAMLILRYSLGLDMSGTGWCI